MTTRTIVLLLQESSSNHGEVNEFDEPQDAERYIEGLLEAGYERAAIRVLAAHDLDLLVTHKPVVSLLSDVDPKAAPVEAQEEPVRVASGDAADAQIQASQGPDEPLTEAPAAEPYTRNGVRFSAAFGSDY